MVNTFEKYSNDIQKHYTSRSLIAGRLSNKYSFSGAKTVKIITPQTVPMSDYARTGANRYGTPTEMQDVVQEMTLSQDKSFSLTIDKGNNLDQDGAKAAADALQLQIEERGVPAMDTYCFAQLCQQAGKVVANSTAVTKSTICERISVGTTHLDDAEVPQDGRTLFVPADVYAKLRLSDEFLKVDALANKALAKGQVGEYDNMAVVKVPSGRWPSNVNFIIAHKNAATAPVKINDTKIHRDPPGISGNLLEGRNYYDLFVFGAKADGVYVEVCTANGCGTVCANPTINTTTGAIESTTTGSTFKFTTDGSDPRYSGTAKIGSTSDVLTAGTVVKAYAFKSGCYPSAVTSATLA